MTFDPEQFFKEIRDMKLRYQYVGTRFAHEKDQGTVPLDPNDPTDYEDCPPLGCVTVSPEELKAIKDHLFGNAERYEDKHARYGHVSPQRNLDNPRQFKLFGITIQVLDAKRLFLEHLDPDSIAHHFTSAQRLQSLEE